MLTGGEDVNPATYGEPVGRHTYFTASRDRYEIEFVNIAVSKKIPIIGICRGLQMLCALSGGKLVQDVTGHVGTHVVDTLNGERYLTSSLHHQMVRPEETDHVLIAWANGLSHHYLDGQDQEVYGHKFVEGDYIDTSNGFTKSTHREPEIVYFNKTRGLGIQGHPEMMSLEAPFVLYCNRLVKEYCLGETLKQAA